ncbi:Fur family transcriptional regulator [Cupriavidus sp. 2TAF22]|uniref:Fur family transcriptional regulator n=1 Tax=unclassified Cupriavidus TaxID=2640874 RepID=UPI003F91A8CD
MPGAAWGESGRLAAQAIADSGLPVTLGRMAVLLVLRESAARHTTAEQLCRAMVSSPYRTALSTFRAGLYELTESGLIFRVTVPSGDHKLTHFYELADRPAHEHLFCSGCGQIDEVFDAALLAMQEARLASAGLRPAHVRSALVGRCRACAAPA